LFVAAIGFALFGTPIVMAQFESTIVCGFQGSPQTSNGLPFSVSCNGPTPTGASYSATGNIFTTLDGIAEGSQVSFASNGVTQTGLPGVALDAKFTGTVLSNGLPSNTPILFQTSIAGEGTRGIGPYGGTYSFSFDPTFPGYFFQFSYATALNINGLPVIPTDA